MMGRFNAAAMMRQRLITTVVIASCSNLACAFLVGSGPRLALRTPKQKLCSGVCTILHKAPLPIAAEKRATRGLSSLR